MRYVYLGDRMTDPRWVNQPCDPVYRSDRTPVTVLRGTRPRNQLVIFPCGTKVVVLGRRLRLTPEAARSQPAIARPEQEADTQTSAVLMDPSPARTEPRGSAAVSTVGRATGARSARSRPNGSGPAATD